MTPSITAIYRNVISLIALEQYVIRDHQQSLAGHRFSWINVYNLIYTIIQFCTMCVVGYARGPKAERGGGGGGNVIEVDREEGMERAKWRMREKQRI